MKLNFNCLESNNLFDLKTNYQTFFSEDKLVKIYLKGVIYNRSLDSIISLYQKHGLKFLPEIDGSFILIIENYLNKTSKIHIITDRSNSLKFFFAKINNYWQISDDIDLFDKHRFSLNPMALACYLANGNMLNSLTLFEGITMAEGACIYTFENDTMQKEKYWKIDFEYKQQISTPSDKLKEELKKKLYASVVQRVNAAEKILVSLSAGYDARSILGLIKKSNSGKQVDTFTYRPTEIVFKESDADLSEKISESLGSKHYGIKSYNGNFIETLKANAIEGKCIANFCDELDAIKKVAKEERHTDVFVGDEWFGRLDVPLKTNREILDSVSIVGSWGINWLNIVLGNGKSEKIARDLDELTGVILKQSEEFPNPHDKKDFLYLHQRVNHVNLTWREYYTSQIGTVHNPYLAREILDFYKKTPPSFRIGKKFFIETITEMLPDLFKIPIANERRSLSGINYKFEITRHKSELIQLLKNTESYLETFVSRNEIINAIELLSKEKTSFYKSLIKILKKVINALRRLSKPIDKILYPILGSRTVKIPGNDKIVLRLLLLWIYLLKSNQNN